MGEPAHGAEVAPILRGRGASHQPMRRRKLVITVAAAALFGVLVVPASAELHRVAVTLVTGQKVTLTVDVPPGTPVESIQIPGLPAPVQSIADLGPVSTATPSPTATASPAPTETPSQTRHPVAHRAPGRRRRSRAREQGRQQVGRQAGRDAAAEPARPERRGADRRARAAGRDARAAGRRDRPDPQHGRLADARQPDRLGGRAGRRPHRRPELLHREVPHPAVPAPDLPGRRHRVRRALGGPRGDQRDRDRLRPQPQRLLGGRARVDAVHALDVGHVRRRRQPGRPQGPLQPGRRDLRRRALPPRRRRRHRPARRDLRLQPRRLVRRLRHPPRALHRRAAGRPRRLAVRADAGPLPRPGQGDLRQGGPAQGPQDGRRREPGLRRRVQQQPQGHQDLRQAGLARRRRERRPDRPHRAQPPARQLRDAAGRLRQHVHLRAPQVRRAQLPDAQAAAGRLRRRQARAAAAGARRRAGEPRVPDHQGGGEGAPGRQAQARRGAGDEGAPRRRRHGRRQGAPLRQPGPPERGGRRRRDAGLPALRGLRLLPEPRLRPRSRRHRA